MNKIAVETRLFYDLTMLYIERRNELTRFLQRNGIYYQFDGSKTSNTIKALCNAEERMMITEFEDAC